MRTSILVRLLVPLEFAVRNGSIVARVAFPDWNMWLDGLLLEHLYTEPKRLEIAKERRAARHANPGEAK